MLVDHKNTRSCEWDRSFSFAFSSASIRVWPPCAIGVVVPIAIAPPTPRVVGDNHSPRIPGVGGNERLNSMAPCNWSYPQWLTLPPLMVVVNWGECCPSPFQKDLHITGSQDGWEQKTSCGNPAGRSIHPFFLFTSVINMHMLDIPCGIIYWRGRGDFQVM